MGRWCLTLTPMSTLSPWHSIQPGIWTRVFRSSGGKKKKLSDASSTQGHASTARLLPHVFSQPCQSGFNLNNLCVPSLLPPPSSSISPPFQKLEDCFEALSLNQELGIPLPAELDVLHQSLSRLHWPKDGSPSQSTDQPPTPTAASPDCSSMTDNGT